MAFCDFNEAVTLNPPYAVPYNKRSALYIKKNFIDSVFADIIQAVRIGPGYVGAIQSRLYVYPERPR